PGERAGVQAARAHESVPHPESFHHSEGEARARPGRPASALGRRADDHRPRPGRPAHLAGGGTARPSAGSRGDPPHRHGRPTDRRAAWVAALTTTGFDPGAASIWLAEGLLFYLPAPAETRLIATVDRLTTGGSALAFEAKLEKDLLAYRDSPIYTATREQTGIDLLHLFDTEPRPDSAGTLAGRGWSTSTHTPFDFTRRHGRGPLPEPNDALEGNRWVFAHKPRP